ncbi:hypothetical protein RFI_23417, partial [Reticulomyxa filosa]
YEVVRQLLSESRDVLEWINSAKGAEEEEEESEKDKGVDQSMLRDLQLYRYFASHCNHFEDISNPCWTAKGVNKSKTDDLSAQYWNSSMSVEQKSKGLRRQSCASVDSPSRKRGVSVFREYYLRSLLYPWCKCDSNTYLRELIHSQRYDVCQASPGSFSLKSCAGIPLHPCVLKVRVTMDLMLDFFCADDTLTTAKSRKLKFMQVSQSSDGIRRWSLHNSLSAQPPVLMRKLSESGDCLKKDYVIITVPIENFGTMSVQAFFHTLIRCIANTVAGGTCQSLLPPDEKERIHQDLFLTDELLQLRFLKEDHSYVIRSFEKDNPSSQETPVFNEHKFDKKLFLKHAKSLKLLALKMTGQSEYIFYNNVEQDKIYDYKCVRYALAHQFDPGMHCALTLVHLTKYPTAIAQLHVCLWRRRGGGTETKKKKKKKKKKRVFFSILLHWIC